MPEVLKKFVNSRKFWAFVMGLVTLLSAAFEDGVFSADEVKAISALIIGYIVSVAWEDGKFAEALAKPTTTIETPATNVAVTTSDAPQSPELGRMGG